MVWGFLVQAIDVKLLTGLERQYHVGHLGLWI
jgi:hypothetical protein